MNIIKSIKIRLLLGMIFVNNIQLINYFIQIRSILQNQCYFFKYAKYKTRSVIVLAPN